MIKDTLKQAIRGIVIMFICSVLLILAGRDRVEQRQEKETEPEVVEITLWYNNTLYESYLKAAKESFEADFLVRIRLEKQTSLDYLSSIQEANRESLGPDLYLIDTTSIQQAVWMGAALRTKLEGIEESYRKGTMYHISYQGQTFGYPLGFDTVALMYRENEKEPLPTSIASMIKKAQKSKAEDRGSYFAMDKDSFLQNYSFFANYIQVGANHGDSILINIDEAGFLDAAKQYKCLYDDFIKDNPLDYDELLNAFSKNELKYMLVNTDILAKYKTWKQGVSITKLPDNTKNAKTKALSVADLVLVNEKSKNQKAAVEFAKYLSVGYANNMWNICGILPLAQVEDIPEESEIFYEIFADTPVLPKHMAIKDYWIWAKDMYLALRGGEEPKKCLDTFSDTIKTALTSFGIEVKKGSGLSE